MQRTQKTKYNNEFDKENANARAFPLPIRSVCGLVILNVAHKIKTSRLYKEGVGMREFSHFFTTPK